MSFLGGKRLETLTVKLSRAEKDEVERIALSEDRPTGFVARSLILKGLSEYWESEELAVNEAELEHRHHVFTTLKGALSTQQNIRGEIAEMVRDAFQKKYSSDSRFQLQFYRDAARNMFAQIINSVSGKVIMDSHDLPPDLDKEFNESQRLIDELDFRVAKMIQVPTMNQSSHNMVKQKTGGQISGSSKPKRTPKKKVG